MARIAWRWEDLTEGTVLYMPLNPNSGASPAYQKNLTKQTTTAPGTQGSTIISEGADAPPTFSFSGVILTQEHYEFILTLWQKRHLLRLTDDLGRSFTLYFESFSPQRELSAHYPWRHTYEASAVVVTDA
jgi:hypothetical protein